MTAKKPKPANSGRQQDGSFAPRQSGNPAGRSLGSRNRATVILDALAEGKAETIVTKILEAAEAGDIRAAEVVLSRIWPIRKGRAVSLPSLPSLKTTADLVLALGAVADAVAIGEVTPDEGQAVAAIFEAKRKAIETLELETRITALEKERNK